MCSKNYTPIYLMINYLFCMEEFGKTKKPGISEKARLNNM